MQFKIWQESALYCPGCKVRRNPYTDPCGTLKNRQGCPGLQGQTGGKLTVVVLDQQNSPRRSPNYWQEDVRFLGLSTPAVSVPSPHILFANRTVFQSQRTFKWMFSASLLMTLPQRLYIDNLGHLRVEGGTIMSKWKKEKQNRVLKALKSTLI